MMLRFLPALCCAVFAILLCLPQPLLSQSRNTTDNVTLSGYVRDSTNGENIIGATVAVQAIKRGAVANKYGFYSLTLPKGNYTIKVRSISYHELEIKINVTQNLTKNFELSPKNQKTNEVVVVANKQEKSLSQNTDIGVIKLSSADVKNAPVVFGEADVLKTIQLLPGVSAPTEGSTGFNVRGGSTDQNLIILDEATVYNPSHLLGFFSVFNTDAIQDFQLFKAGIPVRYGGRLSSVLDVRQREGNTKKYSVVGGIGLISSRVLVEGPIQEDKSSFMVAARRSYADLFLPLSSDESIRDNKAFFYDLNVKANYILGQNDRIYLSGYFGRDRFEVARLVGNSYGNATGTIRWNHVFSDKFFSNFTAIYSNYDYELQFLPSGSEFELRSNIINYQIKADNQWFVDEDNTIEFGADAILYNFVPGEIVPVNNSIITPSALDRQYALEVSGYVGNDHKISSALTAEYGFRVNTFYRMGPQVIPQYEDGKPIRYNQLVGLYQQGRVIDSTVYGSSSSIANFIGLEPRVSLRYAFDETTSFKAAYNRTRQNIHLISNNISPTPLDLYTPSGQYIRPQIADQYAIGFYKNQQIDEEEYELSVEGYFKSLGNVLDFVDGAQLVNNNRLETVTLQGQGRAYGVELLIKKTTGKLTGWLAYTLSRTERRIPGVDGAPGINNGNWYVSNFDKTHNLTLFGTYALSDRWTVSANFVYSSGIPTNYPVGRYEVGGLIIPQFPAERNIDRLPDYHRLDVSLTWRSASTTGFRTNWVFGIYNLYNRYNAASIIFRPNDSNSRVLEARQLTFFGIVPSITWEFRWD